MANPFPSLGLVILFLVCAAFAADAVVHLDAVSSWGEFKTNFSKKYNETEELRRFQIFSDNIKIVNDYNEKAGKMVLGITKFTDLLPEERSAMHSSTRAMFAKTPVTGSRALRVTPSVACAGYTTATIIVDWRDNGTVSSVKDQGGCGGCYAFAALAVLESSWLRMGKSEVSFSPQDVLDCCSLTGCGGCEGGLPKSAFQHVESDGVAKESSYSYNEYTGSCKWVQRVAKAKNIQTLTLSNAVDYLQTTGPISGAMYASDTTFQQFKSTDILSNIFSTSCTSGSEDHAITIVGYGCASNQLFFIVKNSWGTNWGVDGYFAAYYNSLCLNSRNYDVADVVEYDNGFWRTIIIISVCAGCGVLLVAVIVSIICVRRKMHKKQKKQLEAANFQSGNQKLGGVSSDYKN
eukprot:TRINITY_DN23015_c0_g1_i1.p1 TRINITY_DN23015_c0_g1~~TRINITY_DN23015_c0_g1_i1.p1  ORF type:complete len:405 (-),score=69.08 TRINITY_DN23015_c0_g1_i1:75-1289(-)